MHASFAWKPTWMFAGTTRLLWSKFVDTNGSFQPGPTPSKHDTAKICDLHQIEWFSTKYSVIWDGINGPNFGIAQFEPPTVQDVLLPQPEEAWWTMGNHVTPWWHHWSWFLQSIPPGFNKQKPCPYDPLCCVAGYVACSVSNPTMSAHQPRQRNIFMA